MGLTEDTTKTKAYLTTKELAERWHMDPGSLANWRTEGRGPVFIKPGRLVLYPIVEVEAWEKANLKQNTLG